MTKLPKSAIVKHYKKIFLSVDLRLDINQYLVTVDALQVPEGTGCMYKRTFLL